MQQVLMFLVIIMWASVTSAQKPPGTITTYAGMGFSDSPQDRNGNGQIDRAEKYYFEDYGDGDQGTHAGLGLAVDLAVDTSGVLFIAAGFEYRVRRVGLDGVITGFAGVLSPWVDPFTGGHRGEASSGDGGPANEAQLSQSKGVAIADDGVVYISDGVYIRRVTTDNRIATITGTIRGAAIALDASGELYYVSDHQIRKTSGLSHAGVPIAGTGEEGFEGDGGQASQAHLKSPSGLAVDSDGNLYIADSGNHRIRRVDRNGVIETVAGSGSSGDETGEFSGDGGPAILGRLNYPEDVAVDAAGNLYIADTRNNRIRRVDKDGTITTFAGDASNLDAGGFSGDGGPASLAALSQPNCITVDTRGNVYIGDAGNNRVRRVESLDIPFPRLASDFDGNKTVDFQDFISFANSYGKEQGDSAFDSRFDLSGDGKVGFEDFLVFAADFGKSSG